MNDKAYACDANPADKAEQDRLAAAFDESDDVGIEPDCRHGDGDHEFSGGHEGFGKGIGCADCGEKPCIDDGCEQEEENEPGENFHEIEFFRGFRSVGGSGFFRFDALYNCENQRDRDDGERSRQFHDGGVIERGVVTVDAGPAVAGGDDGGGIVDGGACPHSEARIGKPERAAECGEHECRDDVKEKDDGDGGGDIAVFRADNGSGRGDCRTAADGRSHADERCRFGGNLEDFAEDESREQRGGNRGKNDEQGIAADFQHGDEVHVETDKDDACLQNFFWN